MKFGPGNLAASYLNVLDFTGAVLFVTKPDAVFPDKKSRNTLSNKFPECNMKQN